MAKLGQMPASRYYMVNRLLVLAIFVFLSKKKGKKLHSLSYIYLHT
jgi:hypothetical protein